MGIVSLMLSAFSSVVPSVSLCSQPLHTPKQPSVSPSQTHSESHIPAESTAAPLQSGPGNMPLPCWLLLCLYKKCTHMVTCVEHMCCLSGHCLNDILFDFTYGSAHFCICELKTSKSQSSCQGFDKKLISTMVIYVFIHFSKGGVAEK